MKIFQPFKVPVIIGLCLFLSSCVSMVSYFGDHLPATTSVDVYYAAHDVKKDYRVIGHLTSPSGSQKTVTALLVKKAEMIGADAIIITEPTAYGDVGNADLAINADALKYK